MRVMHRREDFAPDPLLLPLWAVVILVSTAFLIGLAVGIGKTQEHYTKKAEEPVAKPGFSCQRYDTHRREMDRICPAYPSIRPSPSKSY